MPETRQKNDIQNDIVKQLQEMKELCDTGIALAKTLENVDDTSNLFDFLESFNEKNDELRALIFEIEDTFFKKEVKE
jgi:hypothetical protein